MSDVLKQRWYVVDPIHLPPDVSPYIIAGHWDAHVGQMVCDMPMPHDLESGDENPDWDQIERDAVAQGWAVARHIVDLHNASLDVEITDNE